MMGNETNVAMYHITVTISLASVLEGFAFEGTCEKLPEVENKWSIMVTVSEAGNPDEIKLVTSPIVDAMIHWSAKRVMRFSAADIEYRLEYRVAQA